MPAPDPRCPIHSRFVHGDEPPTDWDRLRDRARAMPGFASEYNQRPPQYAIEVERSAFKPSSEVTDHAVEAGSESASVRVPAGIKPGDRFVVAVDPAYAPAVRWLRDRRDERERGYIAFRAQDPHERFCAEIHAWIVQEYLGQLVEAFEIFGMVCALVGASDGDDDDMTPERLRERRRHAPRDLDDAAFALLIKLDEQPAQPWTGSIDDSKIVEEIEPGCPAGITTETLDAWARVLRLDVR
jgi:hypothetical protein